MFNEENLPKLSIVCGGKVGAEDQVGAFISSLAYIYTVGGKTQSMHNYWIQSTTIHQNVCNMNKSN